MLGWCIRDKCLECVCCVLFWQLSLTVYDSARPDVTDVANITITVNRNPNSPRFSPAVYQNTIPETFPSGSEIFTIAATDDDQGVGLISLSASLSVCLSVCLSVYLPACLPACLTVSVCFFLHLSLSKCFFGGSSLFLFFSCLWYCLLVKTFLSLSLYVCLTRIILSRSCCIYLSVCSIHAQKLTGHNHYACMHSSAAPCHLNLTLHMHTCTHRSTRVCMISKNKCWTLVDFAFVSLSVGPACLSLVCVSVCLWLLVFTSCDPPLIYVLFWTANPAISRDECQPSGLWCLLLPECSDWPCFTCQTTLQFWLW